MTTDIDLSMKYKQDIRFDYEIQSSISTPTRKCGSVFYSSLSLANEDHNKKYPQTKFN